jgi:hypothetical protein
MRKIFTDKSAQASVEKVLLSLHYMSRNDDL